MREGGLRGPGTRGARRVGDVVVHERNLRILQQMNALHSKETFVDFVRREGPGNHQPVCHAISNETGPLSTAASECLSVAAPKFHEHPQGVPQGSTPLKKPVRALYTPRDDSYTPHRVYPTFISKKKTSEKGLCYVSHWLQS